MASIMDKGDELIIPEPFYANYNGFAAASSIEVIPVVSLFENQFELPPLEKLTSTQSFLKELKIFLFIIPFVSPFSGICKDT